MNLPKKPETLFKERIFPILKKIPRSWWIKTQQMATIGIPDILGCVNGRFVAIELKRSKQQASKAPALQQHVIRLVAQSGGYAAFMYPENFDEILAEIRSLHSPS